MGLLNDKNLLSRISCDSPMVSGFPQPASAAIEQEPFGDGSPIQPASIDLHIGGVFLPGEEELDCRKEYDREPGKSVIVITHETLNMQNDVAAAAFPLAGRRQQGLLMINPGHIDPGFNGKLWFSLINLSRESYRLSLGDRITTVMFWCCDPSNKSFAERYGDDMREGPPENAVKSIAGDALMLEERAAKVATEVAQPMLEKHKLEMDKQVRKVTFRGAMLGGVLPVVATALVGLLVQSFGKTTTLQNEVTDLKAQVKILSADLKIDEKLEKYDALEQKVDSLLKAKTQPSSD